MAEKSNGRKLSVLTAYDFSMARLFDEAGVDCLLVGDSMGMVVQGKSSTLAVTMDQMVYHTEMVSRAATRAIVVADMPFGSFQPSATDAVRNAVRLIQDGGAHAVKLEGGERVIESIRAILRADIPVMGHLGLTPQSINKLGRYHVQRGEDELLADAKLLEETGAFAIVLESVPQSLAEQITKSISIPTIGIGAGPHCDGQVLVWQDAFGLTQDFQPKFVKRYCNVHELILNAARQFCSEVQSGVFPSAEQSYN